MLSLSRAVCLTHELAPCPILAHHTRDQLPVDLFRWLAGPTSEVGPLSRLVSGPKLLVEQQSSLSEGARSLDNKLDASEPASETEDGD